MKPSFTLVVAFTFSCVVIVASMAIRHDLGVQNAPVIRETVTDSAPAPVARLAVAKHDLGTVAKGDVISGFVTVTKSGTKPLRLGTIGGGCRSPQFCKHRKVVPPGSTEPLVIEIRCDVPGRHNARAEVLTDDPNNATLTVDYVYTITQNDG